jgi:hypothetical protein
MRIAKILGLCFLSILFLLSCDTSETTSGTVSLSFSPGSSLQKIANDTLELTEVKLLLSNIELEIDDGTEGDDGEDESYMVLVNPIVINLNLDGTATNFALASVPPGLYEEVEFVIHKVEASETPPDPEFKEGDADSLRYSVITKGNYNSVPFVYKSKKSAHQEIEFETPIEIVDNGVVNLSIPIDPHTWFYKEGILLDPSNPANENDIDNNIKESFGDAYEDDDDDD